MPNLSGLKNLVGGVADTVSTVAKTVSDTVTNAVNKITKKDNGSTPSVTPSKTDTPETPTTKPASNTDEVIEQSNKSADEVSGGNKGNGSTGGSGGTSTKGKDKDKDTGNETLTDAKDNSVLGNTGTKTASPLSSATKTVMTAATGAGLAYLGVTAMGSQTPTPNPDPIVEGGDGQPTYIYQTGIESVDEALNWLQTQVDEIVSYLTDLTGTLFGGSDGSGSGMAGAWDFGTYDTSGNTSSSSKKIPTLIIAVVIIAVVAVVVKKKNGKKTGKKGGKK